MQLESVKVEETVLTAGFLSLTPPLTQLRCLPSCRESLLKATSLPPPPSYSCLLILVDSLSMSAALLAHEL